MKLKKYLFVSFVACSALLSSCDKTPEAPSCKGEDLGKQFCQATKIEAVADFCSDGVNKSYYTYNGKKYECTGVEASTCSAAQEAIATEIMKIDGCVTKSNEGIDLEVVLSKLAQEVLLEVKSESLCN